VKLGWREKFILCPCLCYYISLPLLNADVPLELDFYLKCIQWFILVFVLILILKLVMANDDLHLQTNGSTTNSEGTKIVGLKLLLPLFWNF
jgi:hypothetical protein